MARRKEILQTAVSAKGDVYALEEGGRVIRVRPRVEALFLARDGLDAIALSPSGAIHVVGARHHTNAGGKWRSEVVPVADELDTLTAVWAPTDEDIWVGSEEGELFRRTDGKWKRVSHPLPRDGNAINAIRATRDGDTWIATDAGIARFDGKQWYRVKLPKDVLWLDVLAAPRGRILVAGRDGPNLFEGKSGTWKRIDGIADDDEVSFYALSAGEREDEIAIAVGTGLLLWRGKTTRAMTMAGAHHVSATAGIIAANGDGGVHVFAAKKWTFVRAPAGGTPKHTAKPRERASRKVDAASLSIPSGSSVRLVRGNEFWHGTVRGRNFTVRFGRVGTAGRRSGLAARILRRRQGASRTRRAPAPRRRLSPGMTCARRFARVDHSTTMTSAFCSVKLTLFGSAERRSLYLKRTR